MREATVGASSGHMFTIVVVCVAAVFLVAPVGVVMWRRRTRVSSVWPASDPLDDGRPVVDVAGLQQAFPAVVPSTKQHAEALPDDEVMLAVVPVDVGDAPELELIAGGGSRSFTHVDSDVIIIDGDPTDTGSDDGHGEDAGFYMQPTLHVSADSDLSD